MPEIAFQRTYITKNENKQFIYERLLIFYHIIKNIIISIQQ